MFNPPITGNKDLDAYLYELSLNLDGGIVATEANPDIPGGDPGSYTYQYIQVKYATDNVGTGFSNTPTNKTYFGIYNSNSSTESTNPADYTWYLSGFPFGTTYFLYYLILGGRKIKFAVNTSPPDYRWKIDDGNAIDLDTIVPPSTISLNEILNGAVTELKIAANAVTATKINVAALDQVLGNLNPNTVSASQIAANAVTELKILDGAITNGKIGNEVITGNKISANTITGNNIAALTIGASAIAAGAITAVKIEAGAIVADKIAADAVTSDKIIANAVTSDKIIANAITAVKINAGAVTADKISVANLSAINANLGSITGGSLSINNKFIVDSSGNTTIQSGTTGARLVLQNNVIKVFDASNVLRVQIGDLSA